MPKFIGKDVDATARDGLVDRLHDVERLAARIERQVKTIVDRLTGEMKGDRAKAAMMASLTKRVDKLDERSVNWWR